MFERRAVELARTRDWESWDWLRLDLPSLERGRYLVELFEPNGRPDIDALALEPRR